MKTITKNLKTKCSTLREEHANIRESYNQVSTKYDHLKQENLNTKTSYAEIYEINEGLEKDYDSLLVEYNELVDKFNDVLVATQQRLDQANKELDKLVGVRTRQIQRKLKNIQSPTKAITDFSDLDE